MVGTRSRLCAAPGKKRGRPCKAADGSPSQAALRMRRWRLRVALGDAAPAEAAITIKVKRVHAARPIGRPRLPSSLLTPGGLAKRLYNDAIREKKAFSAMAALATMAARAVAAEADAAVRRARKAAALEKQLSERNSAANGPAALVLRAASRVDGDEACGICCDAAPVLVQSMRCCGSACCAPCLSTWLRRHGQYYPRGYGDADFYVGVDEACEMRESSTYEGARGRGREIPVRMNTHRCPWCNQSVQSVRRGLV